MMNPFKNRKGLGRGLSSLIGDNEIKIEKNKISIGSILPNKFQPRKNFDKERFSFAMNFMPSGMIHSQDSSYYYS